MNFFFVVLGENVFFCYFYKKIKYEEKSIEFNFSLK